MRYKDYVAITVLHQWIDEETGEKYRLVRAKCFDKKKDAIAWLDNTKRPKKITAGMYSKEVYSRGKWEQVDKQLTVSW